MSQHFFNVGTQETSANVHWDVGLISLKFLLVLQTLLLCVKQLSKVCVDLAFRYHLLFDDVQSCHNQAFWPCLLVGLNLC